MTARSMRLSAFCISKSLSAYVAALLESTLRALITSLSSKLMRARRDVYSIFVLAGALRRVRPVRFQRWRGDFAELRALIEQARGRAMDDAKAGSTRPRPNVRPREYVLCRYRHNIPLAPQELVIKGEDSGLKLSVRRSIHRWALFGKVSAKKLRIFSVKILKVGE
jgi:hypothetical protein